jgi:hypothetical protein
MGNTGGLDGQHTVVIRDCPGKPRIACAGVWLFWSAVSGWCAVCVLRWPEAIGAQRSREDDHGGVVFAGCCDSPCRADDAACDATVVDVTDVSPARCTGLMNGSTSMSLCSPGAGASRSGVARGGLEASALHRSRRRGFHRMGRAHASASDGLHGRANRAIALRWTALCACIC